MNILNANDISSRKSLADKNVDRKYILNNLGHEKF